MGSSIDSRIVSMKFDNATFERGVGTTLNTLDKLKEKLGFGGASKGLDEMQTAANRFSLSHMEGGITHVSKSFLALATVAVTALSNIANRAVDAGLRFAKSFTTQPIKDGLKEYETTLNSVQTILANTGLKGQKGLDKVNGALKNLNDYSDKTIYNFGQMARNIGTFTAAGIKLEPATQAIKGIANLAAVSGSSADQASTAMYQLSQALASGSVKLMDWNSVVNAGMGGKVFQKALTDTARAHGVAVDDIIKKEGSFRASLQSGWLTSDILTSTLKQFAGAATDAELAAEGFSKGQIKQIQEMAKTATDAATKVKTMSQLINTLQESAGSGWAQTWQLVFGDFGEAKDLFTGVNNVLGGMISASADARNKVLGDWKKLGGRTVLIEAISTAFHAVLDILKPIREAFRDIFPAKTGRDLYNLTVGLRDFAESLKISDKTSENLKRTFRGVFAIFSIIGQVVKGIAGVFADLFGVVGDGSGSFLDFTGGIGDFLVSVDQALKKGEGLTKFFDGLSAVLQVPIKLIQALAGFISDLFSGVDGSSADGAVKGLTDLADALTPLEALSQRVHDAFSGLSGLFSRLSNIIAPIADVVKKAIHGIGDALSEAFDGDSFGTILDTINTGLFAGLVLLFRKFINGGLGGVLGGGKGGIVGTITGAFKGLTGVLGAMQANLKANTLLKLAGAIALLTVSVVALSLIDSDKLTKALTAMAVGFGQLLGAMAILEKVSSSTGFLKMPFITTSLLILAGAMVLLAAAVKIFSTMSWEELGRGLTGTAGALVIIAGAMHLMPNNLPLTASGLVLVGAGLAAIAGAMKLMGMLKWEEIGKGLVGMGGALGLIAAGMQLMPLSLPITAAGLVLVGVGLTAIAGAMKIFATMQWEQIGKGLAATAGALVVIAGAMQLMPLSLPVTAAGLVAVAFALNGIAAALKIMATMSWEEIGKGLTTLGGAMGILALGLNLMSGTLLGSASLLVAAGALAILTPVLVTLGSLSWEAIGKGLFTLAGAFTVLGVAGLLLTPIIPSLIGLGLALGLVGAGLALAGAGALAFAGAFAIITTAGTAGVAVLTAILDAVIEAIPNMLKALANGIVQFAQIISTAGPQLTRALVTVLDSLLNAVIKVAPKIGRAMTVLIHTVVQVLVSNVPLLVNTGLRLILALLSGIANNIAKIVRVVGTIVTRFIGELGNQLPRILDAGAKFIIKFINGLADTIEANSAELGAAGAHLATAIIEGMIKGLGAGIKQIANKAKEVAKSALNAAKGVLGIHSPSKEFEKIGRFVDKGFADGLVGGLGDVKDALGTLGDVLKQSMEQTKADIQSQKDDLKKLLEEDDPNEKAIAKAKKTLSTLEAIYAASTDARKKLTKGMEDEQAKLKKLGRDYDAVVSDIEDATQSLVDAKKARDDFETGTAASFGALPDISMDEDNRTTVASYIDSLTAQKGDVEKFHETLDTLVQMGLNDAEYNKFLDQGIGIQPFLDDLVAAGPDSVSAINSLTDGINAAASSLGHAAALELKQAGVDAAQGLLDGLISKKADIVSQMEDIARKMVHAIKKELKIKSPSRVMDEVAKFTATGLSGGLDKYSKIVDKSAVTMANSAVENIKKTLSGVPDAINTEINSFPVIAPVLDLTQVRKDAAKIGSMVATESMMAGVSFGAASSISADQAAKTATNDTAEPAPSTTLEYTQNNYSPKALSASEIYRNTKNGLSLAKEALDAP